MGALVAMPRRGQYVEACILSEWHKQVGDPVKAGDPLFTFETDKAEFTENAPCDGEILALLCEEGDDVPCLQGVCIIGAHGEDPQHYLQAAAPADAPAAEVPAPAAPQQTGGGAFVAMPRRGQYVEVCTLSEWHKKPGDPVKTGDALFSFETDKAEFTEYAACDGVLLEVYFGEGDDVPCLENVCAIGPAGMDPKQLHKVAEVSAPAESFHLTSGGVTPRARKLAAQLGLDPKNAVPTGPEGRITEQDIRTLQQTAPKQEDDLRAYTAVPMSNIRKTIAKTMVRSLTEAAQLTEHTAFDATALLAVKEQLGRFVRTESLPKITLNHLILFAVSRILPEFPDLNANCVGDEIRQFHHVNLGMAVDAPRGLLVPVIFGAEKLSLPELAVQAAALADAARQGSIEPDLLSGGSFSVTNIGMFGVEYFTPIINPPQTAILGVGGTVQRPRYSPSGSIELYPSMGLSLTVDHRAVDGAYAARFLQRLTHALENMSALLL